MLKEFSDVLQAMTSAFLDGHVSKDEAALIRREWEELLPIAEPAKPTPTVAWRPVDERRAGSWLVVRLCRCDAQEPERQTRREVRLSQHRDACFDEHE
jgi:hypothetical protein